MNAEQFLAVVNGEQQQETKMERGNSLQNMKRIQRANKAAEGILNVLDQLDNKISSLEKLKKEQVKPGFTGTAMPNVEQEIDRLSAKRGEFVQGLNHPSILLNLNLSNVPNSQIFMRAIDPRIYVELSPEKKAALREQANMFDRVEKGDSSGLRNVMPTPIDETQTVQNQSVIAKAINGE